MGNARTPLPKPGAWARPHDDDRGEMACVIMSVLRAFGKPMPWSDVCSVCDLCFEPSILIDRLTNSEKRLWVRAVGPDAKVCDYEPDNSVSLLFNRALRDLKGCGYIVRNIPLDTLALSALAEKIPTMKWADERARFVLDVLRKRGRFVWLKPDVGAK